MNANVKKGKEEEKKEKVRSNHPPRVSFFKKEREKTGAFGDLNE